MVDGAFPRLGPHPDIRSMVLLRDHRFARCIANVPQLRTWHPKPAQAYPAVRTFAVCQWVCGPVMFVAGWVLDPRGLHSLFVLPTRGSCVTCAGLLCVMHSFVNFFASCDRSVCARCASHLRSSTCYRFFGRKRDMREGEHLYAGRLRGTVYDVFALCVDRCSVVVRR